MSVAVRSLLRRRRDEYALCPEDGHWFRPLYTQGKCPLCGEAAPGGEQPLPLRLRIDHFWLGVLALVLSSLVMVTLVLVMYFKR